MFGTRELFGYQQCTQCGSLQIATIPENLAEFYPPDYYAFRQVPAAAKSIPAKMRRKMGLLRNRALVLGSPTVAMLLRHLPILGAENRVHPLAPFRFLSISQQARIADVGGGNGQLLRTLSAIGFKNLTCIDPFYEDCGDSKGVRFLREFLGEMSEEFDLIMYHHCLEHVPDLDAELAAIRRRLTDTGRALVRLPLLPNDAFDRFGASWVQLDAPRHLHVPSREGLRVAAERNGLRVVAEADDSTSFQWWGSELYARDIALCDVSAHPPLDVFSRRELRRFSRQAAESNRRSRGDQGWFILARA
jgi:SAM-dependent methyltransferase